MIFCAFACAILLPFFLQKGKDALLPRREYYLLCFYEGKDATSAKQASDALSLRGGAGTIYERGDCYEVYACAYENSKDAESVRKRIKEAGGSCKIKVFVLPALATRKSEGENQALLLAEECFSICFSAFTKAYKDAENGKERALICAELSLVREKVATLIKAVRESEKTVGKVAEKNQKTAKESAVFSTVCAFISECEKGVENLLLESTRSALSIGAKRAQLSLLLSYRALLSSFPHK
ncbi:MAG: hypothetical protein E7363_05360 [Clostridiales bacterium]|nr:hypothetical protein [Clostridiales bacterium]